MPFLTLIASAILDVPAVMADAEPNDDFDLAELIILGNYTGTFLDPEDDKRDFYRITNIKPGQEIEVKCTFTVEGLWSAETSLALHDQDFVTLVKDNVGSLRLSWTASSTKSSYEYYIQVSLGLIIYKSGVTPNVSYSLKVMIIDHYDALSGTDAGNSFDSALNITSDDFYGHLSIGKQGTYASVGGNDVEDYYRTRQTLIAGQRINITVTPTTDQAIRVYVFDPNRNEIAYEYSTNPSAIVKINTTAQKSGTYYINIAQGDAIAGYGLGPTIAGDYHLELSFQFITEEPILFDVFWDNKNYPVCICSNFSITQFNFYPQSAQIVFDLSGGPSTIGYCNVTIPKALLTGNPWKITIETTPITDFLQSDNGTHNNLYFTHTYQDLIQPSIQGTWVIPEFPSWTPILFPFLALTIALTVYKLKLHKTPIH